MQKAISMEIKRKNTEEKPYFLSFAIRDLIKIVLCIEVTFFDLLQGSEIRVFSFSACFDQFIEST